MIDSVIFFTSVADDSKNDSLIFISLPFFLCKSECNNEVVQ